jgi:formylmethanofuran dehydrogenase subunit E-like metal-binding protein
MLVKASVARPLTVSVLTVPGDCDDARVAELWALTERTRHFVPVHTGESEVEKNDVGAFSDSHSTADGPS